MDPLLTTALYILTVMTLAFAAIVVVFSILWLLASLIRMAARACQWLFVAVSVPGRPRSGIEPLMR